MWVQGLNGLICGIPACTKHTHWSHVITCGTCTPACKGMRIELYQAVCQQGMVWVVGLLLALLCKSVHNKSFVTSLWFH